MTIKIEFRKIDGNEFICLVSQSGVILYRQIPAKRDAQFLEAISRLESAGYKLVK